MSQYPDPSAYPGGYPQGYDPNLQYASPGMRPPSPRPTSVTVIGIIAIILGGLGVLCGVFGLATNLFMAANGGRNPFAPGGGPAAAAPAGDSRVAVYNVVSAAVNLVLSIVLLSGGIGALKLARWAHKTLMAYAVITIVVTLVNTVLAIAWVGPAQMAAVKQSQPANPMLSMSGPILIGAAVVGLVFGCALPVCILIFWSRANVKAAFERGRIAPLPYPPQHGPGGYPPGYPQ